MRSRLTETAYRISYFRVSQRPWRQGHLTEELLELSVRLL